MWPNSNNEIAESIWKVRSKMIVHLTELMAMTENTITISAKIELGFQMTKPNLGDILLRKSLDSTKVVYGSRGLVYVEQPLQI